MALAGLPPNPADRNSQRFSRGFPLSALLWVVLTLLLLMCGVQLLRGCAIGLPYGLTGWLLDFCPATLEADRLAVLAAEQAQQAKYQAEYDELARQAALKREACAIPPASPEPTLPKAPITNPNPVAIQAPIVKPQPRPLPSPVPVVPEPEPVLPAAPLPKGPSLILPPTQTRSFEFLDGCWISHGPLAEYIHDKPTNRRTQETMCFQKDGSGTRTIRYEDNGRQCQGALHARWANGILIIDGDEAPCAEGNISFQAVTTRCHRENDGGAKCDEYPQGSETPNFSDIPFIRAAPPP